MLIIKKDNLAKFVLSASWDFSVFQSVQNEVKEEVMNDVKLQYVNWILNTHGKSMRKINVKSTVCVEISLSLYLTVMEN